MLFYASLTVAALVVLFFLFTIKQMVFFIRNDQIGVVEKLWSLKKASQSGFIPLNGEAGYQPKVLRGGWHFFPIPFKYRIHKSPLITVPQGTMAYVYARDGAPLEPDQTLGKDVGVGFEDATAWLAAGGQRGPQRRILREGTYAINTALFCVFTKEEVIGISIDDDMSKDGPMIQARNLISQRNGFNPIVIVSGNDEQVIIDGRMVPVSDKINVVTVHDGPALDHDEIIAPTVGTDSTNTATFHNSFQRPDTFLAAGGRRGRQEQVLVEGTYFINRLFATVEVRPKSPVPVGSVGVVISYAGKKGIDTSGEEFAHGELVEKGSRGVWSDALPPGKYAVNPYALDVKVVPTTNFVLRWQSERSEDHGLDSNLSEISLITKDAFHQVLPVSVVLHITAKNAPKVIQMFGDLKLLVEQTLDPMLSAYFKDSGQKYTLLELINARSEIQRETTEAMREKFKPYYLDLMEAMIGTPRSPEDNPQGESVLEQLRMRQTAVEQATTYAVQETTAVKEKSLRDAEATAAAQAMLTQSTISIAVAENEGQAALKRATLAADAVRITAEAAAAKITAEGEAEAGVTKAKADALGGPEAQARLMLADKLSAAIVATKQPLVPNVMVSDGTNSEAGGVLQTLLALTLADKTQQSNSEG